MNRLHRWYCQSSQWKRKLESKILPWSLGGVDLGDDVLEVGPGPGLTTDWLRRQCKAITSIEVDPELADTLKRRVAGTNVRVQCGDATAMPYGDRTFSGAVAFTLVLVDPKTLPARLEAAGFEEIMVEEGDGRFRFSARRLSPTCAPIQ